MPCPGIARRSAGDFRDRGRLRSGKFHWAIYRARPAAPRPAIDIAAGPALQPRLNALGEGAEVGDALKFVVGQFDPEVAFHPGEQVERLQAIDPKLLEE